MRMRQCFWAVPALLALTLTPALTIRSDNREVLFQTSTLGALMAGIYDGPVTIRHLLQQGDFGLGTFNRLDGEMVVLDGQCYQVTSDGVAHPVSGSTRTPFAAVTFFDPDKTRTLSGPLTLEQLTALIDGMLPSPNLFYAVKIEGDFALVKTRSVPPQQKPYPKLVEVVAHQPTFELRDTRGAIVGFRCPSYVGSLNVPGYHLHYLTEDHTRGGHVLGVVLQQATVTVDVTPQLRLALPGTSEFYQHNFAAGSTGEVEAVERQH